MIRNFKTNLLNSFRNKSFALGFIILAAISVSVSAVAFRIFGLLAFAELPYPQADRLVSITAVLGSGNDATEGNVLVLANEWQARLEGIHSVLTRGQQRIRTENEDLTVGVQGVAGPYFALLGAPMLVGRPIDEFSTAASTENVVVLSHRLASKISPTAPQASLNTYLSINGVPHRVAGVAAEGFITPDDLSGSPIAAWIPLSEQDRRANTWGWFSSNVQLIGKIPEGKSVDEFSRSVAALTSEIVKKNAANIDSRTPPIKGKAVSLRAAVLGEAARLTALIGAAMTLIILFSSSMLFSFWTGRLAERQRELATYAAIGGTRTALWNLVTIEATILRVTSGILAWGGAQLLGLTISKLAEGYLPRAVEIGSSQIFCVVAIFIIWVVLVGIGRASVAMLQGNKLANSLSSGSKGATGLHHGKGVISSIVLSVQLGTVLYAASIGGAFLGEAIEKLRTPAGYDQDAGTYVEIDLPESLRGATSALDFASKLSSTAETISGVSGVSMIRMPVATNALALSQVEIAEGIGAINVAINQVQAKFFTNIGIKILAGRSIDKNDELEKRKVIVLGETLARKLGPVDQVIGRSVSIDHVPFEIIGVANDLSSPTQTHPSARLQAYAPYTFVDGPGSIGMIIFHTSSSELDLRKLKAFIRTVDGAFLASAISLRDMSSDLVRIFRVKSILSAFAVAVVLALSIYASYLAAKQSVRREANRTAVLYSIGANFRQLTRNLMFQPRIGLTSAVAVFLIGAPFLSKLLESNSLVTPYQFLLASGVTLVVVIAVMEGICMNLAKKLVWDQQNGSNNKGG